MKMMSFDNYNSPKKLHPVSLLAQVTSRKITGCLQVFNGPTFWSIYLEQGKLIYATCSADRFNRLDYYLSQLGRQIPTLTSAARVQVRLLFENAQPDPAKFSSDYRAICWLVEQQYLNPEQAVHLIEAIARDVMESFLCIDQGVYEIVEQDSFGEGIKFCQIDPRTLVEHCQNQLQQNSGPKNLSAPARQNPKSLLPSQMRSLPSPQPASTNPPATKSLVTSPSRLATPSEEAKLNAERPLKEKYTIVCIDDSPTVLKSIQTFLDDVSFSVVMVNEPVKALMQVIRSKPDLILMDVGMPNLDGYELCSLLRRNQTLKMIPIIMVTGHTGFIDRAKAKLAGASGYLTKPFTQSELLKIVFKHIT